MPNPSRTPPAATLVRGDHMPYLLGSGGGGGVGIAGTDAPLHVSANSHDAAAAAVRAAPAPSAPAPSTTAPAPSTTAPAPPNLTAGVTLDSTVKVRPPNRPGATSGWKGVTLHKRTGKWEAHVWHSKKQVYLGGFDWEEHAAKAHDIMTLKVRGPAAELNFPLAAYAELPTILPTMSEDEVMAMLRVSARPAGGGPRAPPRPVGAGAAGGGRAPPKAPGVAAGGVAKKVVKKVAKKAAAAVAAPAGPPTRKVTRAQAAAEAAALAATAAASPTPTPTPAARPCGGNGGRGASAAPSLLPSMTPHRTPQPLLIPSAAPPATPWWQAPSLCELEGVVGGGGGGGVAPAADGAAAAALADMYMALTGTPGWRM